MNKLKKVLSVLLIGGTILSTGAITFADETTTAEGQNNSLKGRPYVEGRMKRGGDRNKGKFGKEVIKNNIEDNLNALVSSGVITQDKADKILALSKQEAETRQAEMDKIKNMTEDERKAYFEANKNQAREKKNPLSALVDDGTLTQAQLDEVSKVLSIGGGRGHGGKETHSMNRSAKAAADTASSTATE